LQTTFLLKDEKWDLTIGIILLQNIKTHALSNECENISEINTQIYRPYYKYPAIDHIAYVICII
jgi:hypothetical protein